MGGALESSSFRSQHFADALVELEVVLADGSIVTCSHHKDRKLFYGIRGSYGSVGRVTLCTLRLERLADLATEAAHIARQAALPAEPGAKRAKVSAEAGGGSDLAIAGGNVEFRVQVSYVLCSTVAAAVRLLETLTNHRENPNIVPEGKRIHFVDAMLFRRTA